MFTVLAAVLGLAPGMSVAATDPAGPATVQIAQAPLYGRNQNIHPNLLLTLSVEFPTVGAAYRTGSYSPTTEYIGYFNPLKCYNYTGSSSDGYFVIGGDADKVNHSCAGMFSGNFMNWATASAIDMLRYALTGGDRVIDTRTQTVLQRAVLQDSFFNSGSYFPRKSYGDPSSVTPFKSSTIYVTSCDNKVFFGDSTDSNGNCSNPGKYRNKGTYLARVQVCDSNEATSRTDLCKLYRTGYKPVGEMQRNADKVRFGAFGYLNDSSSTRYGGVLRAPMKYVGASTVDKNFSQVSNKQREWDDDGVFVANPEGASENISGVINYLNQFGRSGVYKSLDPVSELYYESIRYLQGQQPTPEAISSHASYKDGFPVYTQWTDPVLASCQKNYVLAIADINTHWDRYVPGNNRTTYLSGGKQVSANDGARAADAMSKYSGYSFDVMQWTKKVADLESSGSSGNSRPDSSLANLATADTGSGGHGTYYMAGTAYWAHTYGFRPDMPELRVTTFGIDVNENGDGTVRDEQRRSQMYLAAKYGGFDDQNGDGNPFRTKGANGATVTSNTEWESATDPNVPANWFLAGQPVAMIKSIKKIFAQIVNAAGTLSGVALTSSQVASDTLLFTPGFDQRWNGRLSAFAVTNNAGTGVQIANTETWEAGKLLTARTGARNLLTWVPSGTSATSGTGAGAGATFEWKSLNATQKAALKTAPTEADTVAQNRIEYLRGSRSQEQSGSTGTLRARDSLLGDIVNSGPVYIAAPSSTIAESDYGTFYQANLQRTAAVYIGANDGMLHAFNAATGAELFGYVPNAVFSSLAQLTSPSYIHRPYVDATPAVAEARVGGNWQTVLVSGMGGGAQGLFALNVTDPATVGPANALWEFTDQDDADMGNVMSPPQIVKLYAGKDSDNKPVYKWFAMTGNGLNSNDADGASNAAAPSVLFILSLDKPAGTPWQLGVNYWKISMPADSAITLANGLSAPALVRLADGQTVAAYAGDLQGRLWKFILNGGPSTWNAAGALPYYGGGNYGRPLFQARDAGGKPQPITIQPKWFYAAGGYMVVFGTGKYVEPSDTLTTGTLPQHSMYGIYDAGGTQAIGGRSVLNPVSLARGSQGAYVFTSHSYSLGYKSGQKAGWYFDFQGSGERQVTALATAYGKVWFNSLMTGDDLCGAGSNSRLYQINALTGMPATGGISGELSAFGILGAPVLIQTMTTVDPQRNAVGQIATQKVIDVFSFGASGGGRSGGASLSSQPIVSGNTATDGGLPTTGRLGWREIRNFGAAR
ncbi:pilus assembly protein [Cupriavidus oxalaticus]|uniref:pilus assembly protein n=1 Tax=Cupriavidus oxalaticus TaxID=96344 RepID=UPI003F737E88